MITLISVSVGILLFLLMLFSTISFLWEREWYAARIAALFMVILPLPYLLESLIPDPYRFYVDSLLLALTAGSVLILLVPDVKKQFKIDDIPKTRIDERDIMFSRNLLIKGSQRYAKYYQAHPEKMALDDEFRSKPGLLTPGSYYYNPITFASADSTFKTVENLKSIVNGPVSERRHPVQVDQITNFIKNWAKKLGAVGVGVTELQDYHLYTHVGRGKDYGQSVTREHKYAVAFTVEMDRDMLASAPAGPTVMESAKQYLASGAIAIQVAEFIRQLGYSARAHIDGNYRVICPLIARDAGLGEIGRMGLLMTPKLGPRVRISVVTTDIPLRLDKRKFDRSVIDFCRKCKKCADICPSNAISNDDLRDIDGAKRWKINSESCYTTWCTFGTDCGRCMSVCPYSHPNNIFHNTIRFGVRHLKYFRRLAVTLDDIFYGRKPLSAEPPDWLNFN